ncbi:glucans biosynthesis glucosyltransferase MdoH [Lacibacterium aquatile]|uniref:Glucans biosynthesis glucosyltransferase H n=1 Tax=Lacibacterium aquatile TaxID=1168082 RepID=A0ABW5DTI6_9PROT
MTTNFRDLPILSPALPPETGMEMPVQDLSTPAQRRKAQAMAQAFWRRCLVLGGATGLTGFAAYQMYAVVRLGGVTIIEGAILGLFCLLFAWIAVSFTSGIAGFISMLAQGGLGLGIAADGKLPRLRGRTALLMPTYNEDPERVMAGLQAIYEQIEVVGAIEHFDIFILSDTTNPELFDSEETAFLTLRDRTNGSERIFYRRREKNIERKAGNIADWVRRWGGAYPQMLILDADSLMSGESIVHLAAAMERNPGVGLIQTLPMVVNGTSLFARLQQFAGKTYGPLIAHGIAWWHGSEGNYWGHNAIIRTEAFAQQCGLPHLKGRKPFGGHILSHDFVEAALLRRGGWRVHMVPALDGSYEESPPSLWDLAIRDRRWCQGNLQHAGLLTARGLHWVSRIHFLNGIGSYLAAPLWLLFLLLGVVAAFQAGFVRPDYFPKGLALFPTWPQQDPIRALWLFIGTLCVLLTPKLLAFVVLLVQGERRRGAGGAFRAFLSLILETLLSALLAPVTMINQTGDVISILLGQDSGWKPQTRDGGGVLFRWVARRYALHTVLGMVLAAASYAISTPFALWMAPVTAGLVLAIPLAWFTASSALGVALQRWGILAIPEERRPVDVLVRAATLRAHPRIAGRKLIEG